MVFHFCWKHWEKEVWAGATVLTCFLLQWFYFIFLEFWCPTPIECCSISTDLCLVPSHRLESVPETSGLTIAYGWVEQSCRHLCKRWSASPGLTQATKYRAFFFLSPHCHCCLSVQNSLLTLFFFSSFFFCLAECDQASSECLLLLAVKSCT